MIYIIRLFLLKKKSVNDVAVVVFGTILGLLAGWIPRVREVLLPISNVITLIPPLMFSAYLIMILSTFRQAAIAVIFFAVFWPTFQGTVVRVGQIDKQIIEAAKTMGVGTFGMLIKVIFPYCLPGIIGSLSKTTGATLGPFECWLVLRGLKTLAVRMERHSSNAREIKAWLEKRDDVDKVFYAGSGMISFYVKSADKAISILKNIKLITFAESLGGTESLLAYPIVQTHPDVSAEQREKIGINDRLLCLSVGLEAPSDLINDLGK